jgi:cobaltochelatase CobN
MHLLPVTAVSLEEAEGAIDLAQSPGDVVVLSFADSDLSTLAAAHKLDRALLPSLRLASLRLLRHPMSVDLYVERIVSRAKFVLVRCLGGLDYWRYGLERVSSACRTGNIALVAMPGDDRPDRRLTDLSTAPPEVIRDIEACWRSAGIDNLRGMLRRIAGLIGREIETELPSAIPAACAWTGDHGIEDPATALSRLPSDKPLALVIFYRSSLLSGDTAPIEALSLALAERGLATLVLAVSSLKDEDAAGVVCTAVRARRPAVIISTTAFSAREDGRFVLDEADAPVIQALQVGAPHAAWASSARGLGPADLAMQIALPEFDGRIISRPIAFKEERPLDPALGFAGRMHAPHADGVAGVADLAAGWVRLAQAPAESRKLALVLSDYPARGGRIGFAVGLDTPASVCRILDELGGAGYAVARDFDGRTLMHRLSEHPPALTVSLTAYRAWLETLPEPLRADLLDAAGPPERDPAVTEGSFRLKAVRAGNVLIAVQPDRSLGGDRKATYHDTGIPPSHAYLAFYLSLRAIERVHALIHLGTHGTTEWLPGKAVALSGSCWPQVTIGGLPLVYPFIVNDPGEAAPAKRRTAAVTIGHLTPPVTEAGLHGEAAAVKDLVEELSQAQVLDLRRAALVAREIIDRAQACGLAGECGVTGDTPIDKALLLLDAHLCDLADLAIRDGLHVLGQAPAGAVRERLVAQIAAAGTGERDRIAERLDASASAETAALLRALDGRFVVPGPAGSPARGHLDALPTGRNLATLDPRAVPTRTATVLGERAAAEFVRQHLQDAGDWPRRIVVDLWASPTMRSGGEDMAMILALMGVRPTWHDGSSRLSGFEIVPLPRLDRPRIDVTVRISGAFRDTFPTQLALLDQAARSVAALDEDDAWNELAAARRRGTPLSRIFGAAPGRFGAGVARKALDEAWSSRSELGRTYLDHTSHSFGGPAGEGAADVSFTNRVAAAQAFVHVTDTPDRDILDGDDAADSIGGLAAAADAANARPLLYSLDTSQPGRGPRVRTLETDIARLVRGRLSNPRWIAGQLRHGWRGASEIAQAVDTLYVFAASTSAVTDQQFDAIFAAYVGDEATFAQLENANPAAARSVLDRFREARRRGLWLTRRNSIAARLDSLSADQMTGAVGRAAV